MPHSISSKTRASLAAAILLTLASLALAACGSSSSGSTSTTSASATTSTTAGGAPGARDKRFAAVRECLQKNGVTLPKQTPGRKRPSGGGFLSGAPTLPKGVTRAQYEAAIKKCGGFAGGAGRFGGVGARFNSPAFKQALAKFAACMKENGVKVPAPNTSGKGPIFNTKGLNTSSAQFKTAETKCSSLLRSSFKASPGSAAPGGPGGAPAGTPGGAAPAPAG